jgi:hypothetical protein
MRCLAARSSVAKYNMIISLHGGIDNRSWADWLGVVGDEGE